MKLTTVEIKELSSEFPTPDNGPWHVLHNGLGMKPDLRFQSNYWYIGNENTGIAIKIGRVKLRGKNYYDAAIVEAARRNEAITGNPWPHIQDYL